MARCTREFYDIVPVFEHVASHGLNHKYSEEEKKNVRRIKTKNGEGTGRGKRRR